MLLKSSGSAFDIDATVPEAPSPPESLQGSRAHAGVPQRPDPQGAVPARHHGRPRHGPVPVPAVQGRSRGAQVPQGRKEHRGHGRRPGRRSQLSLLAHRSGPAPSPGSDEDVRLLRPGPGAARRLRRANLSPGRHRHSLYAGKPDRAVLAPGHQGRDVQRPRPGHRVRPQRVHLRPARQRQDGHGPLDRRVHEPGRRRDLRSLRLPGRRQHRHRLRSVAAPGGRERRTTASSTRIRASSGC